MFESNLRNKTKTTIIINVILVVLSVGTTFIISSLDFKFGVVFTLAIIASPLVVLSLINPKWGVLLLLIISFFIFLMARLLPFSFPTGTLLDGIIVIVFLGILLKEAKERNFKFKKINNNVTKALIALTVYNLLEIANPYGASLGVAILVLRGVFFTLLSFFIIAYVIQSFKDVKVFTSLWIFLAFLAGLYGIYQELFGFADFEWRFINSVQGMYSRLFIWGHLRKFSFLSDVAAFGMLMSFTSIFCIILVFSNKTNIKSKVYYIVVTMVSLLSMVYSGTRTAYVMLPIGLFLFFLLNMRNIKVIIASSLVALLFMVVLFGPFYSGPFRRLKSAFQPDDDPSMNVRKQNIKRIQPYIWSHPFGGGLMTTGLAGTKYARGHKLSGFPTDSGYLRVALEMGTIGLLLTLYFYGTVVFSGIKGFLGNAPPMVSDYIAAYTCSFFALSVANLTQDSMSQRPVGIIIIAAYFFIPFLSSLGTKKEDIS